MKRIVFTVAASLLLAPTANAEWMQSVRDVRSSSFQPGVFTLTHASFQEVNGLELPNTRREWFVLVDCRTKKEARLIDGEIKTTTIVGIITKVCTDRGFKRPSVGDYL